MCPRCGLEWVGDAVLCPACGFDRVGRRSPTADDTGRGVRPRPLELAWLASAGLAVAIVAFGAGWQLRTSTTAHNLPAPRVTARAADPVAVASIGPVLFAERLGESLELESYRTKFTRGDTIAWRAEFLEPPPAGELTMVIAWQSIRERMELRQATVMHRDPGLTMVASDEVPLDDLVPTAGLYSVAYFAGDIKLAEGIFEVLPPER
jgi:hypothetical protein